MNLEPLRDALAKATPGPWPIAYTGDRKRIIVGDGLVEGPNGYEVAEVYSDDCDRDEAEANATLISLARDALPDLLAEITRQREVIEAWHDIDSKRDAEVGRGSLQSRVQPWLLACFGAVIAGDREERNHRFLEEALELVQACGCTSSEAHQLVDYVYGRPVGDPAQEAGGVMITLAALCLANALNMHDAGEVELARIWTKVEQIRAKQAAKPKYSPLPQQVAALKEPSHDEG